MRSPFSKLRYLGDCQGNSVPCPMETVLAAMRYTEIRMAKIANIIFSNGI